MEYTGLSDAQAAIACSDAKKIIVCAGSGSGKTRTLTERVKMILESGESPRDMVVITFTNMAADELRERLADVPGADKMFVGTIHAYANSILQRGTVQYDIFSESHQTRFMSLLIPQYARYCTIEDYKLFVKYDRMVEAGMMSASELQYKFPSNEVYREIVRLLGREKSVSYPETVVTLCQANNIITFDELLTLATEMFNNGQKRPKYLFVDELQDIGYLEYNFLMSINSEYTFCIGDDFQSIFGFKGGDVNIFLNLMHDPEWKAFYLTENYRTASSILMYANNVIKNAHNIIKKDVVCKSKEVGTLDFKSSSLLESYIKSIPDGEDWFILTRTNKEMRKVEAIVKNLGKDYYCYKQSTVSDKKLREIRNKKCIKIMTVHASKGQECDNVALFGKFPFKKTTDEDEYKVFYVGITRAKSKCVIFI